MRPASYSQEERLKRQIRIFVDEPQDAHILFDAFEEFQRCRSVAQLVASIRPVLVEPHRLHLFDVIRRLIPNEQQQEYAMLTPYFSPKTREVQLYKRKGAKSLGFSIRGGKEHGIGIFISDVESSSEAHVQGLRVGDQILRVNGFSIEQAIHKEVINIFRSKNKLTLKVRSVGLIPVKDKPAPLNLDGISTLDALSSDSSAPTSPLSSPLSPSRKHDPVTWKLVDSRDSPSSSPVPKHQNSPSLGSTNSREIVQVKLFIDMTGHSNLGCSICKGPPDKPGIYIQSTKEGGLARDVGLRAGDQIIGVNGIDLLEAEFQVAVKYIKAHQQLEFLIRKGVACDLFPGESSGYNSSSSSVNGEVSTDETLKKLPTLEEETQDRQNHLVNTNGHLRTIADGKGDPPLPMNVQRINSVDDNNDNETGETYSRTEEHKLNNNDDESDSSLTATFHERPGDSDPPDGASSMSSQSDESESIVTRIEKISLESDDVADRGCVMPPNLHSVMEDVEQENLYSMHHRKLSEQSSLDERFDAEMVVQEIVRAAEEEMQKRAWEDRLAAEADSGSTVEFCSTNLIQGQGFSKRSASPTPSQTDSLDSSVPEKDDPPTPEAQRPSPQRSADIWRRTVIAEVHNNPLPVPPPLPKDEPPSPASKPKVPQQEEMQRPPAYLPEPPPQPMFLNSRTMGPQELQEAKTKVNIPESPPQPKTKTMPSKKVADEMQKKMHHDQLIEEFKRVHKMMNSQNDQPQSTKQSAANGPGVAPVLQNWPVNGSQAAQDVTDSSSSQSFVLPLEPPKQFADVYRGDPKRSSVELREHRVAQRQIKSPAPSPTPPSSIQEPERFKPPDNPPLTSWQRTVQERDQSPSRLAAATASWQKTVQERDQSPSRLAAATASWQKTVQERDQSPSRLAAATASWQKTVQERDQSPSRLAAATASWQKTVQERNQSPSRLAAATGGGLTRSPSPSSPPHITDSRYEVPKPPSFFFPKEAKATRRGPLVTIGTYQSSNSRPAPSRFGFLQQQLNINSSPSLPKKSPPPQQRSPIVNVKTNAPTQSSNSVTVTHNGVTPTKSPPTSVQVNGNIPNRKSVSNNGYPPMMSNLTSNKVTIQVPATEPPRTIVRVESPPSVGSRVAAAVASREPSSILKQAGKAPNAVRKKSLSFEECPIIIEELPKPESVVVEDFNPLNLFTKQQVSGREVKMFSLPKANPLDIQIEGGLGSFLAGRVIVADISEGGEIYKQGVICKGDQLMWVNGHSLLDITLSQAQGVLREAAKNIKEPLKLIVAKAPPGLYDDVTFF